MNDAHAYSFVVRFQQRQQRWWAWIQLAAPRALDARAIPPQSPQEAPNRLEAVLEQKSREILDVLQAMIEETGGSHVR